MGVAVAPMFFSVVATCAGRRCAFPLPKFTVFVLSLFTGMAAVAPSIERLLAEVKPTDEQRALEQQHPCTPLQPGQVDAFAAQATPEGGQADAIRWGWRKGWWTLVVALAVAEWCWSPFTVVCTWDWAVLADRGRVL